MHVEVQRIKIVCHVRECSHFYCSILQLVNVGFVALEGQRVGKDSILNDYVIQVVITNDDRLYK